MVSQCDQGAYKHKAVWRRLFRIGEEPESDDRHKGGKGVGGAAFETWAAQGGG